MTSKIFICTFSSLLGTYSWRFQAIAEHWVQSYMTTFLLTGDSKIGCMHQNVAFKFTEPDSQALWPLYSTWTFWWWQPNLRHVSPTWSQVMRLRTLTSVQNLTCSKPNISSLKSGSWLRWWQLEHVLFSQHEQKSQFSCHYWGWGCCYQIWQPSNQIPEMA